MGPFDVAIIGAGQIGSRHLQAMALFPHPVRIHMVDPSQASLDMACARFQEVKGSVGLENVHCCLSIKNLPDRLDLAIIATGANVRKKALDELLHRVSVPYLILEKFLFQHPEDFPAAQTALESRGVKAWVNCPRRAMAFYQDLRTRLGGGRHFGFTVAGSNIGIGCNGIHYLDLMAFLTGDDDFTLSSEGLDPVIIPSKRPGYMEFCGHLQGSTSRGNRFSLSSFSEGSSPVTIHISTETMTCVVREQEGKAWCSEHRRGWAWEELSFSMSFQSQLTHLLVQEILQSRRSRLTTFEESARLHLSILDPLITHMNRLSPGSASLCPIT